MKKLKLEFNLDDISDFELMNFPDIELELKELLFPISLEGYY